MSLPPPSKKPDVVITEASVLEKSGTPPTRRGTPLWTKICFNSEGKQRRLLRWLAILGAVVLIIAVIAYAAVAAAAKGQKKPVAVFESRPITNASVSSVNARCGEALATSFADPSIIKVNGTWYAYATNNAAAMVRGNKNTNMIGMGPANVQIATSTDFVTWTIQNNTDPASTLGAWVVQGASKNNVPRANVWAPHVLQRPDGKFVLYYSAVAGNATGDHCVGAAVGDSPSGPFTAMANPIACQTNLGGTIDPYGIVDADGSVYVAYKVDGNNNGNGGTCKNTVAPLQDTPIMLQKTDADGVTPIGSPTTIMNRESSDGPLVEAPSLVRTQDGTYFLFFSSGCTSDPSYDIKYATATKITGPYTRASQQLLKSGDMGLSAPGSVAVMQDGTSWRMAFHARTNTTTMGIIRAMYTANLALSGTTATIQCS